MTQTREEWRNTDPERERMTDPTPEQKAEISEDGRPLHRGPWTQAEPVDLMERLADAEHASWARWMGYVFSLHPEKEDGTVTLSANSVAHWKRQVATPYADLTEREKESDREEVRRILPLIEAELEALRGQLAEAQGHVEAGAESLGRMGCATWGCEGANTSAAKRHLTAALAALDPSGQRGGAGQ